MAKITLSPKCRLCRREGEKLFLKGEKCFSAKCAVQKKPYPPGAQGKAVRFKLSAYGKQLRAKQKAKKIYFLGETQLRNAYKKAQRMIGSTDYMIMKDLEMRLANAVYKVGIFDSPNLARQAVSHGHFLLNGRRVDLPNIRVKDGDVFEVREKSRSSTLFGKIGKITTTVEWAEFNTSTWQGKIKSVPKQDDLAASNIDFKAIVEYYSR